MSLKRPAAGGKSCRSRSLSCREQDKTGFNDLVCWTARWRKKMGSLEKRHGIVEKSLVEYVSCGKPSVQKG